MSKKKVLILGSNGMLGNALFLSFLKSRKFIVKATSRDKKNTIYKANKYNKNIINNFSITNFYKVHKFIKSFKPHVIINCIGVTNKQIHRNSKTDILKINSMLPKFLNQLSEIENFKFIHISTDCVFDGKGREYFENTFKSARDIYGLSKSLGEEINNNDSLIIRTSIIGHELKKKDGLLEWFLSQKKSVSGYDNVLYSGLTTVELSNIIIKIVTNKNISGLYHISSNRISKFRLLDKIKKVYSLKIKIHKNITKHKKLILNSDKFRKRTNIKVKSWEKQLIQMRDFYLKNQLYLKRNILK